LTLDPLVFSVADFIMLLVSPDVRLESLSSAMSHQDSNFRRVFWNPYWTKALAEHLRDPRKRCLYLWNRSFSCFQLTRATFLCVRNWGFVGIRHIVLLIKILQGPCKWPLKLPISTGRTPTWVNHTDKINFTRMFSFWCKLRCSSLAWLLPV